MKQRIKITDDLLEKADPEKPNKTCTGKDNGLKNKHFFSLKDINTKWFKDNAVAIRFFKFNMPENNRIIHLWNSRKENVS